jgi:hypothetical protein
MPAVQANFVSDSIIGAGFVEGVAVSVMQIGEFIHQLAG